jgi:hypothetical protein
VIFLDSIWTVFLSDLVGLRTLDAFGEQITVFLMNNCWNHLTSDLIVLFTEAQVHVIPFAAYTTQIFQVLDVTLFGALKRHIRSELPCKEEKKTVKFIMKGYHDFKQTMVEPNRWEVLQALEFGLYTGTEPFLLLFSEKKQRKRVDFRPLHSTGQAWKVLIE